MSEQGTFKLKGFECVHRMKDKRQHPRNVVVKRYKNHEVRKNAKNLWGHEHLV
jgi:hypothetical protein